MKRAITDLSWLHVVLLSLFTALGALFVVAVFGTERFSIYDQYVCSRCGLCKTDQIKKWGRIEYCRRIAFSESPVSQVVKANNCAHNWLLYRSGHTTKKRFRSIFVDGGSPSSTLQLLLGDDTFGHELAEMRDPSSTWAALVSALNTNRAFDAAFANWRLDPDRSRFSVYAATNNVLAIGGR